MKTLIDLGNTNFFWPLNACVGTNGRVSEYSYFEGYAEATKRLCLAVLSDDRFLADTLIYPIIFNARHSLEIALKISLKEVDRLNDSKSENNSIVTGHNLFKLFNKLKEKISFHPRITSWPREIPKRDTCFNSTSY